ncbi:NlpC/P60 family protein [Micromonospora sp. NPDC049679]|uniref:C40 family peptidase n=1 Tax=Micromonospora sp. NPDC049679 TaxID=3155920 RepID=UPI0034102C86
MARALEDPRQPQNREHQHKQAYPRGARDRGRLRTAAHGLLVLAAAVTVGVLPAGQAQAAPSVDEIERQIDAQWQQLEPVIEQYNKVHSQLKANQKKQVALEKKIRPLSLQAELALFRVGQMANQYYRTGPSSDLNALLETGSANTLTEQLTMLDRLTQQQQDQIAGVTAARDKFDAEKRKLDALVAQQQKQDAELAAKKKQVDGEIGRLQKLRLTAYGAGGSGGSLRIGPCPPEYPGGKAGTAVKTACAQIGKPYVWGATGPSSFDCSGLTQFAWGKAGVSLTHYTGAQWNEGTPVTRSQARAGDLVFFRGDLSHVGMYVGNGLMVHAPTSGDVVRMASIDTLPIAGFRRPG